jgi:hypothetical protein
VKEGGDKGQFYKARKQDQKKEQCRITKHDKERIARLSKTVAMARRLIPIFFPYQLEDSIDPRPVCM